MAQAVVQCEICAKARGSSYCLDCMKHFCENCAMINSRKELSRNHYFIMMPHTELKPKRECEVHSKIYVSYCVNCNKPVCAICIRREPSDHNIIELRSALSKLKTAVKRKLGVNIENLQLSIENVKKGSETFMEDVKHVIKSIQRQGEKVKHAVDKEIQQLVQSLLEKSKTEIQKLLSVERNYEELLNKVDKLHKAFDYTCAGSIKDEAYALESLRKLKEYCETIKTFQTSNFLLVEHDKSTVHHSDIRKLLGTLTYQEVDKNEIKSPEHGEKVQSVDIQLSDETYPRIINITSWLKAKQVDIKDVIGCNKSTEQFPYHLTVFHAEKTEPDNLLQLFDGQSRPFPAFDKENIAGQIQFDTPSIFAIPTVVVLYLQPTADGFLAIEDKNMVSDIIKQDETDDIDVLFVTDIKVASDLDTFLVNLGDDLAKTLPSVKNGNTLHRQIFTRINDKVKQRIGLYLERQIKRNIISFTIALLGETRRQTEYLPTCHLPDITCMDILTELQEPHPDSCELHELETCLERMKNVSAFGIDQNEIAVYVNSDDDSGKVHDNLEACMPDLIQHMTIKVWFKNIEIEKYQLKQGSKITRSDDRFGTLGMFVKDMHECLYFTTCAHVIPREHHAFDETKICLGKSVFDIEPSFDRENNDRLDLSIVKVEEEIASRCQLGLRNISDRLISGKITDEGVIKSEVRKGLKVYKWGAKTGMTRGTYRGVIAKKNEEDVFDHILHKIMYESETFAEEGDSGSLVCFEATGSPQFQRESAAYIFVGKLMEKQETDISDKEHFYMCYHISNVFDCKVDNVQNLEPCLHPINDGDVDGDIASGSSIQSSNNNSKK